jgi:hypothetical protein
MRSSSAARASGEPRRDIEAVLARGLRRVRELGDECGGLRLRLLHGVALQRDEAPEVRDLRGISFSRCATRALAHIVIVRVGAG